MPFRIGPWEIALILVIILIVFGVGRLPQVGGAIGKGIRNFRKGPRGEDIEEGEEEEPPKSEKLPGNHQSNKSDIDKYLRYNLYLRRVYFVPSTGNISRLIWVIFCA